MKFKMRFGTHYPIQSPMGRLISGIFLAAGLLVCIFGAYRLWSYHQIESTLVPVDAVIARIEVRGRGEDRKHRVYVSYTHRGEQYDSIRLNHYNSDMDIGDHIPLKIHPDDPSKPVYNDGLFLLLFGGLYTLIGGGLSAAAWRDKLKERFSRKEELLC